MSYKRSRKDFEADLQKQESPYVLYGTPLPPLDDNVRDDGSFVPVWQQEVRDERGRKRLHGAFTGGWSAGYFNTVGSKEGWAPSTFVSSRTNRAKDQKNGQPRPEDFMDDEDLAEAEASKQLQTASSFAGLGTTEQDSNRQIGLLDIFRPSGPTMGIRLLQKMGWREGQGIGPKVRRAARNDGNHDTSGEGSEIHLFAPENAKTITFQKKKDHKGLGFAGEQSLARTNPTERSPRESEDENEGNGFQIKAKVNSTKQKVKGGFGMGVLNDTGSDDEDPYTMGPKISYNRVIGGDKKKTKKSTPSKAVGAPNPLLGQRPVFNSRKPKGASIAKCHDGRLPLDGFVLAVRSAPPQKSYPPPRIPEGWQSKFSSGSTTEKNSGSTSYVSTADAAKASSLDPKSRAGLLGEEQLPGKSVFDFLSPAARDRLVTASGRSNLPAAGSEPAPEGFRMTDAEKAKDVRSMFPELDQETAVQALTHRSLPYAEDEAKRRRYRAFLSLKTGATATLPERAKDDAGKEVSTDEYINEMREFAHAAKVFRPMSGTMATRFTSSSATVLAPDDKDPSKLLSTPAQKPVDPAEEAARLGMYGPMTRLVLDFYPTRLLCKRFNVKPPAHVQIDPGGSDGSSSATTTTEPVSRSDLDRMMQDAAFSRLTTDSTNVGGKGKEGDLGSGTPRDGQVEQSSALATDSSGTAMGQPAVVDAERNEALEKERPGEAIFRAIFGSDDEDE